MNYSECEKKDTGIYYDPPPVPPSEVSSSKIRFSRSPAAEVVPGLGKNIIAIKLFLPQIIKEDLQTMADKTNIPLSTFIREILISHFLGHTLWQERLRPWSPEEEMVGNQWEEGITESQYIGLVDGSRIDGAPESNPEVFNYGYI